MQKIADKMITVSLKLPSEVVELVDFMARNRASMRNSIVTRSEVMREILEKALEFPGKKRKKK
jgi:metal-responsive CopG/Arc/MetJ family transcriptional regulator